LVHGWKIFLEYNKDKEHSPNDNVTETVFLGGNRKKPPELQLISGQKL